MKIDSKSLPLNLKFPYKSSIHILNDFHAFTLLGSWANLLGLTLSIIILTISPVFAEQYITFQKTLDVKKNNLQDILIDVRNYEKIFPDFVRSVDVLDKSEDKTLTEIHLGFGLIPLNVKVEHNIVDENIHELSVISGDLKGTKVTTTLKKTWGFNGLADEATIVQVDMSLQVSGFLAWLGIIDENLVHYALDSSLLSLQEFSHGKSIEEIKQDNPVQKRRR